MSPPTLVPNKTILRRWKREGLTQRQMVERHELETGILVSRATIAAAMVRYGLAEEKPRYNNTLPWRVHGEHISEYPARMLRLLGRRINGGSLNVAEVNRLDSWIAMLRRENAVVGYDPDSAQGFHYVEAEGDEVGSVIPIRVKIIRTLSNA